MKQIFDASYKVKFDFDYTDTINGAIEDGELTSFSDIRQFLLDCVVEDIQDCLNRGLDEDQVKITIHK